jgi:hypothetical protein
MREDEIGGTCSMHRDMRNAYKNLIRKLEGRLRRRWEYNIKINLRKARENVK